MRLRGFVPNLFEVKSGFSPLTAIATCLLCLGIDLEAKLKVGIHCNSRLCHLRRLAGLHSVNNSSQVINAPQACAVALSNLERYAEMDRAMSIQQARIERMVPANHPSIKSVGRK